MSEPWNRTVRSFAAAIRARELSARDAVEICLERIAAVNPSLNAVVELCADRARAEAAAADEARAAGRATGPLHGVPMTMKDSFDTAGVASTWGTLGRRGVVPDKDATVVARLRDAGAILLGKTNTPELTLSFETDNLLFGRTSNPYDTTRSSGGSSGGEAAIVAAGGVPFGLGTDTGGSIRLPSHWNGVAGLRPTSGRVPRTGHAVDFGTIFDALTTVGPIARSVDDVALLLGIVAGPDGVDPAIVPAPLGDPAAVDLAELRVAVYANDGVARPTAETIATVEAAAKTLAASGAAVVEDRPPGLEEVLEIFLLLFTADAGHGMRRILEACGTKQISPVIAPLVEVAEFPASEVGRRVERWDGFRKRMLAFLSGYDAILCPVNAEPAMKHGFIAGGFAGFGYTFTYNLTGWPGAVVRCGTSPEGLPIGVQVVARPWREDVALAIAKRLEEVHGGWSPPAL